MSSPLANKGPAPSLGLDVCDRDLGIYQAEAYARFGTAALSAIILPPLDAPGALGRGELRAVATLYWAWHLERAGLPRFTERLADQFANGRLLMRIDAGGARRLATYLREQKERHTLSERRQIYSRLFGAPGATEPNRAFPAAWKGLIDALIEAGARGSQPGARARVAVAAQVLLGALAPRAGGALRFDAERILAHVREALEILQHPDIGGALGGGPPLHLLTWHAPHVLGEDLDPRPAIAQATAGADVLRWLADHLDGVRSGLVDLTPGAPLFDAAAILVG